MYFDVKNYGGTTEILDGNDYQAVEIPVSGEETVKAGMPMKNTGETSADGTGAIGILLYDVDPKRNPAGAVVVDGIINWAKCKASVGESLSLEANAISKLLPNITFRDADGKTYVGAASAGE